MRRVVPELSPEAAQYLRELRELDIDEIVRRRESKGHATRGRPLDDQSGSPPRATEE